jgi:hypothetical protein
VRGPALAKQIAALLKAGKNGKTEKLAGGSYGFFGILIHDQRSSRIVRLRPGCVPAAQANRGRGR